MEPAFGCGVRDELVDIVLHGDVPKIFENNETINGKFQDELNIKVQQISNNVIPKI